MTHTDCVASFGEEPMRARVAPPPGPNNTDRNLCTPHAMACMDVQGARKHDIRPDP